MNLIDIDRLRKELMAKGDIPIYEVFNTIWEQPIVNICEVEEQQPCEDCISILNRIMEYTYGMLTTEKFGLQHLIKSMMDDLPSVTPQQARWIPVSERLPEKTGHYLIQYSRHICPDEMAVAFYSVEEAEVDENYTWEFKPFADCKEVIAWMPLPEPYKAESEE